MSRIDDPKGDISTIYQMASLSSDSPYKLQVIKYALRKPRQAKLFLLFLRLGSQRFRLYLCGPAAVANSTYKLAVRKVGWAPQQVETRGADTDLLRKARIGNMASECRERPG